MRAFDLGELARAAEAEIRGGALPVSVEAVGTDTRSLPPASLFVALRGERFDGHAYAGAAVEAGARAILVDAEGARQTESINVPRLVVADTLRALGDLAALVRRSSKRPVVALTGSNGKTTTKEMLAAILSERGPVHKTAGNFNNLIGLPLTIFDWPEETWAAVLEMGMNAPGEIARLTEIASPNVGLVTNVGPAHLEGLGSIEAVARAKAELYDGLPATATAVVNADDAMITNLMLAPSGGHKVLRFGTTAGCDVRVVRHEAGVRNSRVVLEIVGASVEVGLPLVGHHNALNAAAAATAAWAMGMSREQIAEGLSKVQVPGGRLRLLRDARPGIHIIDDTYNANPASMRAAFSVLNDVTDRRAVAVLGTMFELGDRSAQLHHEVGALAAASGATWLLALGDHGPDLVSGAADAGIGAQAFETIDELLVSLDDGLQSGDWVLVKGSRGMRMERVVAHLTGGEG